MGTRTLKAKDGQKQTAISFVNVGATGTNKGLSTSSNRMRTPTVTAPDDPALVKMLSRAE